MRPSTYKKRVRPLPPGAKVIAVYPVCNFGGVELLESENGIEDQVEVVTNNGDTRNYMGAHKVYLTKQGRAFFKMYGLVYYLDQFMRLPQ